LKDIVKAKLQAVSGMKGEVTDKVEEVKRDSSEVQIIENLKAVISPIPKP
jgi:hypothetical protein